MFFIAKLAQKKCFSDVLVLKRFAKRKRPVLIYTKEEKSCYKKNILYHVRPNFLEKKEEVKIDENATQEGDEVTLEQIIKRFLLIVHPDRLGKHPGFRKENEQACMNLNSFLSELKECRKFRISTGFDEAREMEKQSRLEKERLRKEEERKANEKLAKRAMRHIWEKIKKPSESTWSGDEWGEHSRITIKEGTYPKARKETITFNVPGEIDGSYKQVSIKIETTGRNCRNSVENSFRSLFSQSGLPVHFKMGQYW